MIDLDLETVRGVAHALTGQHNVSLLTPESDPLEIKAIRLLIAAATPVTAANVAKQLSFYAPEIAEDVLGLLPEPYRGAIGPSFPLIGIGSDAWNDAPTLASVIAHELGHHLRDKAVRAKAGIIGSGVYYLAYLVHPMVRIAEESTCYTCDVSADVILRGTAPLVAADRALTSLKTVYRADDSSPRIARATLASVAASLTKGQLPGVKTPLQETLQALRRQGVDFGAWNDAIGVAS